jgi:hypothetical protein
LLASLGVRGNVAHRLLACAFVLAVFAQAPPPDRPRLFVSTLAQQGVPLEEAQALTDAVVATLSQRGLFQIVSTKDLETALGAERQRQLLGVCEADPAACAQGVAQAVTARFVLSGQLSRLGSAYQLSLQMVDTQKGQPVARSLRLAGDIQALRALVPYVAAEATGSPLPPPPSKVLPMTLVALGSAALVTGAVLGMLALSRQEVINDELCPGGDVALVRCSGVSLRPRDYYVQQDAALSTQKTAALALLVAGAAVAVVGVLFWPKDTGPHLALVPSPNGLGLAGLWP